jgi:diacylglycerol O-acyltransferase / wax synthase
VHPVLTTSSIEVRVKRLSGWDAVLLYNETENVPMHTLKIAVVDTSSFDGEFNYEVFCEALRRRLHLLEPLRYQLVEIPLRLHHPMWMENVDVDVHWHVRRAQVEAPGGRRQLDELIGRIASTRLDRSRPLWEFHFVEGMADGRFAIVGKIHHALADGMASANLMARSLDRVAAQHEDDYTPSVPPSTAKLLAAAGRDHLQQIGEVPKLIKNTAGGIGRVRRRARERGHHPEMARNFNPPATFLNHVVSPTRTFATATLALGEVKETSKLLKITINELILSTAAGALRELLLRYDGGAESPILGSVPVSLDTDPDRVSGNDLGGMMVSLPVQISDPLERVRITKLGSAIAKENFHLLGPSLLGRWSAYTPPPLAGPLFGWLARRDAPNKLFNVPISNVPGPRERRTLAGAPMSEIYSVGPVMAGSGMNITVWSYVDQVNVSVIADDQTVQDPHEVTDAMVRAFSDIRVAAGLTPATTDIETAMAPAFSAR